MFVKEIGTSGQDAAFEPKVSAVWWKSSSRQKKKLMLESILSDVAPPKE
jgi:hypothetical protein